MNDYIIPTKTGPTPNSTSWRTITSRSSSYKSTSSRSNSSSSNSENNRKDDSNSKPSHNFSRPRTTQQYIAYTISRDSLLHPRRQKMATYFLTGANRGIGLEFVRQLSANPKNTIIAGVRSLSGENDALHSLATQHNNVHVIECDVSSLESLAGLEFRVAEILSKTGANLDFLFNVAGINATSSDTSLTLDPESVTTHMQTNVIGPAKIVSSLQRYLARGATVLNMTSGLASLKVATETTKCCTYSMSKAALNMLTLHQAADLKKSGVKVVCMDPGWVKTRMGGKGAMIEPEVSVGSMLEVVHGLKEKDSGRFLRYDGVDVPW